MNIKYVGLTTDDVEKNQKMYGKNIILYSKQNKALRVLEKIIKEPILLLLLIYLIVYITSQEYIYTIVLLISIILLSIIKLYQIFKINKIDNKLKGHLLDYCTVIRNEKEQIIKSENVTVDDILLLKQGDKVVADAIILENYDLYTDESCFTNDNSSIKKSSNLMDINVSLKSNYVYKGTFIIKGYGIAKVVNIGNNTEIAKKNIVNENNNYANSKLQKLTKKLDKLCIFSAIIVLILTLVLCFINKTNLFTAVINSITLSLICLFARLNLPIQYLINKEKEYMVQRNVIIKDHLTIENINKLTYLCVDKDTFITQNKIIIKQICPLKKDTSLVLDALLSTENYYDELYQESFKNYLNQKSIIINYNDYKLVKRYKYNNKTKLAANIYKYKNENYIYVQGNLESIFDICNLNLDIKYQLHNLEQEYSKKGLEVIAVASKKVDKIEKNILNYDDIEFSGIIGLYKPPKENVKELIDKLQKDNIKLIMLSKDDKDISAHMGKLLEINNHKNLVSSKELDEMSNEQLASIIKNIGIIYNISTQNKNRVINALKKSGEFIGITCDEITDKNVIKYADILITTKYYGTDMSKALSNIILLDENLETIINTINYSDMITQKTRKFISYNFIYHIIMIALTSVFISTTKNIIFMLILEIIFNIGFIIAFSNKKK